MGWLIENHKIRFNKHTNIPTIEGYELVSNEEYWNMAIDFSTGRKVYPIFSIDGIDIYFNKYNMTLQDKRGDLIWKHSY